MEHWPSTLKGNLVGHSHLIRAQDVRVVDGLMVNCELSQEDCLHLGDTYVFPQLPPDNYASFIFDGQCFRLIETAEQLLCLTERILLLNDRAELVTAFVLASLNEDIPDMYFGLPQLFDSKVHYTLIARHRIEN
ncbi:hypothetical protein GCM10007385_32120 [Tateyamaria omphalii]|uniref:hypothetical protein n=1 Tax=Tateyamaria omphalii TaxID=299262 RepID=UPI001675A94E|nr:hypothetical protein [Tateyamaria omphalii]GGX60429.1 hypothetical protein GCM10007385_32120 [Tateyamaria omphalii]